MIYCTGLGATNPPAASGQASPVGIAVNPVSVTIGGIPATVLYAGLTPGLVGLYQVNVVVPAGVSPGSAVPLVLRQEGTPSNIVTMAVR